MSSLGLTETIRVPIIDAVSGLTLEQRIEDACDVQYAAGLSLAAAVAVGNDIVLIFQTK
jgi:hypothetical protein